MRTRVLRQASQSGFAKLYFTVAICCVVMQSTAQICQGSLGDPIVNISFGSGPNPGPPLSAVTTNYTYVSTDCPKDGNYAVRNKTENCFDNMWFPVTDHTGDPNGYFMLVNASFDPGQFYLDTVKGLCAGTTYEFAAWLINVSRPILCWGATKIITPNITFRIEKTDGTILQSYNTGDISASDPTQWKQYGFFFTTPSGVNEVVLRMLNNAPGGCGNDVGLDDITFRPCGPQVNSYITATGSSKDTLCSGSAKSYALQANASGGYSNPVYQWQKRFNGAAWNDVPGETTTSLSFNLSPDAQFGSYQYRVLVAESGNMGSVNCRVASLPVEIYVKEKPSITAVGNSPVCEGASINLSCTANNVTWTGPNGFSSAGNNIVIENAQQSDAGDYYATTTSGGCSWSDTVNISVTTRPVITVNPDSISICEGDSIDLSATGAATYTWQPVNGLSAPSSGHTKASPRTTIVYSVIGASAAGCSDTAYVNVNVIRKPEADAGLNVSAVKGSVVQLNGKASGDDVNYYWTPDYQITGEQTLSPAVTPDVDTFYVLHVVSDAGCGFDTDTVRVTIYKQVVIPNAFSPNGDGINDQWNIAGLNSYSQAEIIVFDRYGREVLKNRGYKPWNGTRNGQPLPVGVYYYLIDLRNGSPKLTGNVYLAR